MEGVMIQVAVLDDYQGVAIGMADWRSLDPLARVQVFADHLADQAALARRLHPFEAVVLMRERTPFPRALIERLPNLRVVITAGRRNASIDMDAASERGILVCGTDMLPYATAELTWGLIIALVRQIPREEAALRAGRWQTTLGRGLKGKTLGIVGLGNLGRQVAAVGAAFGMSVIAWSQNLTAATAAEHGATWVEKAELFARADVVTIHLVLSDRTRGLIGAADLARMKPDAYLVNTSRGPIVEEKALIDALFARRIAGAAIDVYDREPLPADHPFCRLDNVVLTPHLGYVIEENYRLVYPQAVEAVAAFLKGAPVRVLNRRAG
jgi:phosphoglycerate dehydrogenase-like enzyme